ncbi:MAG: SDR family oxidoreductase [Planctomycetota bacterium]|nr:SDR family oxidoreductase [Planctomycetota bacterium]
MPKREIKNSRAIVTGASSGIGRAIALELARQGARVVAVARREQRLAELAREVARLGGEIETLAGDITDDATRRAAVEAAQSRYGGLDILVNNAGVGAMGPFEKSDPQRARTVMEVNFFATIELTRLALPLLHEGTNPIIVNISSIVGLRGTPHNSVYSASKFAVQGFSESLRAELARDKVAVLVVSPGTTQTEFFDKVVEKTGEPAWPEHKPVTPEAVARQTVHAIRRGKHAIIPYFWGRVMCWINRLSPSLMDRIMSRYA